MPKNLSSNPNFIPLELTKSYTYDYRSNLKKIY